MSFGLGDARKRPGIFDSFRAAMTPPPLPEDDGQPIKPPGTVTAATVLAMLAGLVFLIIGGFSLLTTDDQLDTAVASFNATISECTTQFQGVGDAVVVPADASADASAAAELCKKYQPLTDEIISGARTQNVIISIVLTIIGLIALAGGWFLRTGARWSRLAMLGAVVMSVILTMAFQVSNLLTLVATLLMIIAVMLSFVGKGGIYFARLKARRAG